MRPTLVLVTPYLASANNGNWRTASRWARMLGARYRVILQSADADVTGCGRDDAVALVALHARRSRAAIASWRRAHPEGALVVALTGTDLYRDVPSGDADALASMAEADRLIVLQEDALAQLPATRRSRASVVLQSARALKPWTRQSSERLDAILVAHLREEKDPRTALAAWRELDPALPATLSIVGAALDPALGDAVRAAARADKRVRWFGTREHGWTRQAIKRAHVLVNSSLMEGGANVVTEALTAGTPVLASRMSGNVGLLGADYPGYFAVGDAAGLARLVERATHDRAWLALLQRACARRAKSMTPEAEARSLLAAVEAAIDAAGTRMKASGRPPRPTDAKATT